MQPEEGISWRLNGKVPGGQMDDQDGALDLSTKTTFNVEPPEAYERLIYDAMLGDQTLFIRGDEAEEQWSLVDAIAARLAARPASRASRTTPRGRGARRARTS